MLGVLAVSIGCGAAGLRAWRMLVHSVATSPLSVLS
jgi:hypothetical protein